MPLKQPLFFSILNMDYSKKFTKIESEIENKSETSKCKKRLSSINVIFFLFITVFFQNNSVFVSDVLICFSLETARFKTYSFQFRGSNKSPELPLGPPQ